MGCFLFLCFERNVDPAGWGGWRSRSDTGRAYCPPPRSGLALCSAVVTDAFSFYLSATCGPLGLCTAMPHAVRVPAIWFPENQPSGAARLERGARCSDALCSRLCSSPAERNASATAGDEPAGHRCHAGGAVGAAGDRGPELRHVRRPGRLDPWAGLCGKGDTGTCRPGPGPVLPRQQSACHPSRAELSAWATCVAPAVKAVMLGDRGPGPAGVRVGAAVPGGLQPVCSLCRSSPLRSNGQHSERGKPFSGIGGLGSKQSPPDLGGGRRVLQALPEDGRSGAQGSAARCPVSTLEPRLL